MSHHTSCMSRPTSAAHALSRVFITSTCGVRKTTGPVRPHYRLSTFIAITTIAATQKRDQAAPLKRCFSDGHHVV